jgi:hypothetical protein
MRMVTRQGDRGAAMNMPRHFCTAFLLLTCISTTACGGSHAEYAPSSHPWIGKCATFSEPMAYLTNLTPDFGMDEILRIGRMLTDAGYADYLRKLPMGKEVIATPVPLGTTFEVTAIFMIVHEGYSRMFVDDTEMAVLRDNRGQVSTSVLIALEPCN